MNLAFMALSQRLEFRQTQSLVMTPQLMQAIKLLQLSNLDLAAFVEEELERNPLLERATEDGSPVDQASDPAGSGEALSASAADAEQGDPQPRSPDGRSHSSSRSRARAPGSTPEPELGLGQLR